MSSRSPEPEDAPGHYNNSHRAFLQAVFARSTITFEEAKPIVAAIMTAQENRQTLPNDVTFEDFNNFVNTCNAAIHQFDYEIRCGYPQSAPSRTPDTALYAIVNLSSDPQTQFATTHTPDEIAFVKRVLDAIFETNNTPSREIMAVKSMEASSKLSKVPRSRESNVSTNGDTPTQATQGANASITVKAAEEVLDKMVKEGWLLKSRAGYLSLSARALMELSGWLVETYNEEEEEDGGWQRIKFCEACRDIVTVGQQCSNRDCLCRLHDFCTAAFFRSQTERKCPKCKTEWTSDSFVGERAARGGGAPASRTAVTAGSSRNRHVSISDQEDSSD